MKKILLILIAVTCSIGYGQEEVQLVGLSSTDNVYQLGMKLINVPDFTAPIQDSNYLSKINDTIEYSEKKKITELKISNIDNMIKGLDKIEKEYCRKYLNDD